MGEDEALERGVAIPRGEEDAGRTASSSSSEMTIARRRLPNAAIPGEGEERAGAGWTVAVRGEGLCRVWK